MGQGKSGWEYYWRRHPREVCPKCGKKTYIQPSEAGTVGNDGSGYYGIMSIIEIDGKLVRKMLKRCYKCGYKEGQPLDAEN